MPYLPIEDYGAIGDLRTVALCGVNGSVDWLCLPDFDSPAVFAAILDHGRGGHFSVTPADPSCTFRQMYLPDTNVLITRFLAEDGVGELTDLMPPHSESSRAGTLLRSLTVIRGAMRFRIACRPRFDYGRAPHRASRTPSGVRFESERLALELGATTPLELQDGDAVAEVILREGQSIVLRLAGAGSGDDAPAGAALADEFAARFRETVSFWRRWVGGSSYRGRWREMVNRSALVLKLLTFAPTGGLVAAATTSLPEAIGGRRNWDYRYTWIRDASLTVRALMDVGFAQEAQQFIGWLEARCGELDPDGSLHIMYGIRGEHHLPEEELSHLEGYRGSAPVRVGNGAAGQLQLDIYGALMDALYRFDGVGEPISYEMWRNVRRLLGWLTVHWREADEGIWEVRGGRQHFLFSRIMCWVAFDRGLRLAALRGLPSDPAWQRERDAIWEEVMERGWDRGRAAFAQALDTDHLDAAVLLMPMMGFIAPGDPRMRSTLDAILADLVSNSLVYRYDPDLTPDGVGGREGTFNLCTFWLVEALAGAGRVEEAQLIFEKMLTYANHLGLYAEQLGHSGEALGNFPQAFTHLALISAAARLDRALDEAARGPG